MKKFFSTVLSGLILSITTACSVEEQIILPDVQTGMVNSLAKTKNNNSVQQLTFATYNIRNLFDGVQNPGKLEEKAKPEKELQALSDSIHKINADVIALQEVESKATLRSFRDKYLSDMGYEIVLREGNDQRGIDVAALSRLPVLDVKNHRNVKINVSNSEPDTFSRDLLQLRIKANDNYIFTLFTTHLKSQHGGDQSDAKRKGEAMKIRQIIRNFEKQNPKTNYVLAGDFNDVYNAPSLAPILDPRSSGLSIHDIIFEDLGTGSEVYSYHPKQYRSRIDYILVSAGMFNEYIEKSVNIHKMSDTGNKWMFFEASDHLPITSKFDVSKDF